MRQERRARGSVSQHTVGSKPCLLLVEGRDEKLFFTALLRSMGCLDGTQVEEVGGKDQFPRKLPGFVKMSGFSKVRSLGIIRDADDDPRAALQSIQTALGKEGLPVPVSAGRKQTSAGGSPDVSIFIMPGRNQPGALEDLILASVKGQQELACVTDFFACLDDRGVAPDFSSARQRKREVHVLIGAQDTDARLLGEAARAGVWSLDSPAFDEIKEFLRDICRP